MSYKPVHKTTEKFASELRKMGMDEDSIELQSKIFDTNQELVIKASKIALDSDKDEKLDKERAMDLSPESTQILKNEKELNNDKAKDKDMEEEKEEKVKGMDMAAIEELMNKKIADYDLSCKSKGKAMDEALNIYKARYNSTIACDSADAVYDAILSHEGISVDKKATLDMKKGMVSMLSAKTQVARNFVVGDSTSVKSDDYYAKLIGV